MAGRRRGWHVCVVCWLCFGVLPVSLIAQTSRLESLQAVGESEAPVVFQTAEVLFRFPAGGLVSYGPVGADGLVWFMTDGRVMHVISEDGRALGKRSLPARQLAFIVCDPFGRALVPEGSNQLSLINRAGQSVWTITTGLPDFPPVFNADGSFFLASGNSLQLRAPNGQLLWRLGLPRALKLAPQVGPSGNILLVFSDSNWQLHDRSGRQLAKGDGIGSPITTASSSAPAGFWLGYADGRVQQLSETGATAPFYASRQAIAALAAHAGHLFVLDAGGQLAAFEDSPDAVWQLATGARSSGSLVVAGDRLFLSSLGLAATYNLHGNLLRELRLSNSSGQPWIGTNGSIFSGGRDWILYAYRFERPLTLRPNFMPPVSLEKAETALQTELFWVSGGMANEESLLNRLLDIEKSVKSGTIGAELEQSHYFALALVAGLIDFSTRISGFSGNTLDPGLQTRLKACEILGLMGNPTVVPVLADLFRSATDTLLRSAAADAIARIGLDPDGSAMRAFEAASRGRLDARTALSLIAAVEALQRGGGAVDLQSGAAALVRLLGSDWPQTVRSRADQALKAIGALR